jgi:hypothetical protein
MSHTPAPWHWASDHTHRQFDIYQPSQQIGKHICTINNVSPEMLKGRNPDTALANAKLIAAAPDLLEALCTALPFVEDHADDHATSGVYKSGAVARAVAQIRAAIEQATN